MTIRTLSTLEELRAAAHRETSQSLMLRLALLDKIAAHYDNLTAVLAEFELNHVWADHTELNIALMGDKRVYERVFGALRRLGFVPEKRPELAESVYVHFKHPDGAAVYLAFSSTVCRRVQVGTRTVEEPIYEVHCDDGETAEDEAPMPAPAAAQPEEAIL